jgi:hypothetical protein
LSSDRSIDWSPPVTVGRDHLIKPELSWGWRASDGDGRIPQVEYRGVLSEPPGDTFALVRERRRIVFDNLPDCDAIPDSEFPTAWTRRKVKFLIYSMIHNYNVAYVSDLVKYYKRSEPISRNSHPPQAELVPRQGAVEKLVQVKLTLLPRRKQTMHRLIFMATCSMATRLTFMRGNCP